MKNPNQIKRNIKATSPSNFIIRRLYKMTNLRITISVVLILISLLHCKGNNIRIINGDKADAKQFPWQAAIFNSDSVCGGALIFPQWILTAGHCVFGYSLFQIQLGSTLLFDDDSHRVTFNAEEYILHENYNNATLANDIALIKLPEEVTFNDYIVAIGLPSQELDVGAPVTVSGWGRTSDDEGADDVSNDLMYVKLVTISNDDCKNAFNTHIITENNVCASGPQSGVVQSTCQGDSGGPLIVDVGSHTEHVGVVSFGDRKCESGKPAAFTRTYNYIDWIKSKTGF